jgi:hypothetical protein
MRLHPLYIFLSVPALFIACSSGGPGSAPPFGSPSAFGQNGATTPALGTTPEAPKPGGQTPDPPADTGTTPQDTGGGTDTRPPTDTGGTTGDPVCARPSKCSDTFIPADVCNMQITKCGSVARTYFTCLSDNQVCDGTGATDFTATTGACTEEGNAYTSACPS